MRWIYLSLLRYIKRKLQKGEAQVLGSRIFNLIHHHILTYREQDGIPRNGRTDVRVWRIAWLLISASCVSSRVPISWVSIRRSRGIWVRPRVFGAHRELLIPTSLRRKAKSSGRTAENRKSGKTPFPRSFDIRPLDHRYHSPSSALPSPYLSLTPTSVTTNNRTLLRYLAKALPRSRHVHLEDNVARLRSHSRIHIHININIYVRTGICIRVSYGKCDSCRGIRAIERTTLTNCETLGNSTSR